MKKIILVLFLVPGIIFAERIQSFDSEMTVNLDGSVDVVETIVYDFESQNRRGIFRNIPLTFSFEDQTRRLEIDTIAVTRDGVGEPYVHEGNKKEWKIKIGDQDVYHTGQHTYVVAYQIRGAIRNFADIDEWYWNVTGNGWNVPMDQVTARIHLPNEVTTEQAACYQGALGSHTVCDTQGTNTMTFRAYDLGPREGVTVAVGFTPGVVTPMVLMDRDYTVLGAAMVGGTAFAYGLMLFRRKRKHYKKQSIITQFEPYQPYSAIFSGYVFDGGLQRRDIVAGLIELAQHKVITIVQNEENKKEPFSLVLQRTDISFLRKPLQQVVRMFFEGNLEVSQTFVLKKDKVQENAYHKVVTAMDATMKKEKIKELISFPKQETVLMLLTITVGTYLMSGSIIMTGQIMMFVLVFGFVFVLFMLERKTVKGYEIKRHLQGLRQYIKVAEQDRMTFHDAPGKTPEVFSALLPYAVAFGLEKQWTRAFKDIDIQQDWLEMHNGSITNTDQLVGSLTGFSTAVGKSAPISSVSSSSGSGGGGFSGGGGGGGGGGSW